MLTTAKNNGFSTQTRQVPYYQLQRQILTLSSPLACPACHGEGFSSALPAPCSGMSNVWLQQYACMCAQPERVWSLSPFTITIK